MLAMTNGVPIRTCRMPPNILCQYCNLNVCYLLNFIYLLLLENTDE